MENSQQPPSPTPTSPNEPSTGPTPTPPLSEPVSTPPTQPPSPTPSVPSTNPTPPVTPPPVQHSGGKRFPWIIVLIILLIGFLGLAAWYFQSQLQKSSTAAVVPTPTVSSSLPKEVIIGTDPTFQPMEYTQNGKMVGYDIDLSNLLAKELGVKVEFKNIVFDNLFNALQQHQIDMIVSAVTITPERQKKYEFSDPYLNAGEIIITQKSNTTIKSPTDLKGKKIGVQQGTTDEAEALKFTDNKLVIRYPDFVHATKALVDGDVDAIVTDLPSAQGIIATSPTLKISSDPFTNDYYGIVFRKNDPSVKQINKALDSLRTRGYLTELKHKWLD
jgi:polar amino acid transport system substrate-binding protein